jgi:cobalt-zinc-cadmium efflux system outer membrane protein
MKLTSEKQKFLLVLEGLKTDLKVERKKLALMLSLQDMDFDLEEKFQYTPLPPDTKEIAEKALNTRTDIKAQAMLVDAMSASLSLSRREAMPSVALEAGYKRWAGGLDGFVFGLTVPLPLFDRNQGKIAAAQAEKEKQSLTYELMKRHASSEIDILMERISYLQTRISGTSVQLEKTKELTKISGIAYEEGEASLIEVLDAVRSEKESSIEYNNALYEYWASVFEMERATSTRIFNRGGKL